MRATSLRVLPTLTKLPRVNPTTLKLAFIRLFKDGMPIFYIIRCDRDKSLNALANTYFAKKGILLLARRSVHHMAFLEGIIRNVKKKFIKNMRMEEEDQVNWSEKKLEAALKDVVYSYNHVSSSSHGFQPAAVNSPEFDPILREKLYGEDYRIQRFEDFYTEQLKLLKKVNTPRPVAKKRSDQRYTEKDGHFKKGDLVYIDFDNTAAIGRAAYKVQRGSIHEISRVNVIAKPYLYKLQNIKTQKDLHGWYYAKELARADLTDLEIEEVIKKKKIRNRKLIYAKFKDHKASFNRWIVEN